MSAFQDSAVGLAPYVGIAFLTLVLVTAGAKSLAFYKSDVGSLPEPDDSEWIWGHERTVFMNDPGRALRAWVSKLGLTFKIKAAFGAPDVLVLCDPTGIAHILQKKIYDYHHSRIVRPRVARLLGRGLGWVEGEDEHKRMRRLVSTPFTSSNLKQMSADVEQAASVVVNNLTNHVSERDGSCPVNLLDWTGKAVLNVVGRVIFNHDFEGGESVDAQKILDGRRKGVSPIVQYAGFLTLMLLRRFPILNDLPIGAIQAQSITKNVVQTGVAKQMVKRQQQLLEAKGNKAESADLLGRLIDAEAAGQISTEELYEQISTFVVSGHETTTQSLAFTMWELARNPAAQEKLREEVSQFSGIPSYDDFRTRLPYLDAVLRETLRLYPGLPYMERLAMKDDVIPLGTPVVTRDGRTLNEISVRKGQTVMIPIISIHRLDEVWRQADKFIPERWIDADGLPPSEALCAGWSNTLAFSDGPRNCIGSRLAIYQFKVILAQIITKFSFQDTGAKISLKVASSLQPWVVTEPEEGPQMPVLIKLLD
ncbi:hypothetical protein D9615_000793 [Tricholomella constricta]|uniref:Cytochrome P450 n=1 Tax=Tricholomella constricta TaxID=117010 RepID=A0A8H5HRU7_9AGAR|nr:hypothetical protein D9615_000793 [Tricholomella constricta]